MADIKKVSLLFFLIFLFLPKKLSDTVKKGIDLCTLSVWSYSVMVITHDSESCDPGSSPGRTLILHFFTTQTGGVGLTCLKHCFNMPGCPRGPRGQT